MHPKKQENISNRIKEIIRKSEISQPAQYNSNYFIYFSDNNGIISIGLGSNEAIEFDKVIAEVQGEKTLNDKFSSIYIYKCMHKIISRAIMEKNLDNINNYFSDLMEKLDKYNIKQTVFVPVKALIIKINKSEIEIGNVKFKRLSDVYEKVPEQLYSA
ncbi:MAG: hypothetical protein K8T10_15430 [Candidatus Eremiobacteraeota bacterium]|nr:hypothetical protein [Candidatus Eremiobacteraeota bacterium]